MVQLASGKCSSFERVKRPIIFALECWNYNSQVTRRGWKIGGGGFASFHYLPNETHCLFAGAETALRGDLEEGGLSRFPIMVSTISLSLSRLEGR